MNNGPIINTSDTYRCIFVHIPKVAGSSVKEALGLVGRGHPDWRFFQQNYLRRWQNYYKFTIIRNPWDRVVSAYAYARMQKSYWHNTRMGPHPDYELLKDKSFSEFCALLRDDRSQLTHESWYPQHMWIADTFDGKNEVVVDKVLKFENLENEFNGLMKQLGIEGVALPHVNKSSRQSYREYYDKETEKIIRDVYLNDIELFEYNF